MTVPARPTAEGLAEIRAFLAQADTRILSPYECRQLLAELDAVRAELADCQRHDWMIRCTELEAALAAAETERDELKTVAYCYDHCGYLGWTFEHYGKALHKHACPRRARPFCQSHPDGCPEEGAA